jgi:hypothetical protein
MAAAVACFEVVADLWDVIGATPELLEFADLKWVFCLLSAAMTAATAAALRFVSASLRTDQYRRQPQTKTNKSMRPASPRLKPRPSASWVLLGARVPVSSNSIRVE